MRIAIDGTSCQLLKDLLSQHRDGLSRLLWKKYDYQLPEKYRTDAAVPLLNQLDDDPKSDYAETMHRTIGTISIKDDLLFIADFSGLVHCLNAKTGEPYWSHDMLAASWGSALIVDGKVYIGDEDGEVTVFKLSPEKEVISEVNMGNSVYSSAVVANNILFMCNKDELFAIKEGAKSTPKKKPEGGEEAAAE